MRCAVHKKKDKSNLWASMVSMQAGQTPRRIVVSILGPLSTTPCENKYILVVGNYFSTRAEAYPLLNQKAQTVAKVFVNKWVYYHRMLQFLHTNQKKKNKSQLFLHVCKLLKNNKPCITLYHPQDNKLVKWFNHTLVNMLSSLINNNQTM